MADRGDSGGFGEDACARLHSLFDAAAQTGPISAAQPDAAIVARLLEAAEAGLAPGARVPWRVLPVDGAQARERLIWNFEVCNADALAHRHPRVHRAMAEHTALRRTPVQRAVFAEPEAVPTRVTDVAVDAPVRETAAAALTQLRLAARAAGLVAVWITGLDADALRHALNVPTACPFVGHVCLGYPAGPGAVTATKAHHDDV